MPRRCSAKKRHQTLTLCAMLLLLLGGAAAAVERPVIGIDLGTTYSVVGVYKNGQVQIVPNEMGNRITPSVVGFTDTERLVGDGAKNQMSLNPANTIYAVKRLIGRKYSDKTVVADRLLLSYNVTEGKDQKPMVRVEHKGETKTYTPEEISAMILGSMKNIAEDYLGEKVKNAVITVPAYFNDAQRQSTKDAGTIAGLNVVRVINEPTAAAMAYGMSERGEKNILVFDLGGGTFDVSVLQIDDGFFEVISTNGDTHLGGEDFDNRLVKHFLQLIKKKHGKDLAKNQGALARLRKACEAAKRQLSSQPEARVEVDGIDEGLDFSEKLTRAKFEELNMDLFKGTLNPVKAALADAKLKKSDIDEIVVVGGSTRIPKVQSLLKDYFNGKDLNKGVNPDEAVAHGATVQGAVLSGEEGGVITLDIVPLSLGIETVGGVMTKIIDRNTPVPANRTQTFSTAQDNQRSVNIQVLEGERAMSKDNRVLGSFELSDIPLAKRGVPQIKVSIGVDANAILSVSATEHGSGQEKQITISGDRGGLSTEDVLRMVEEAREREEEDRVQRERVEARNNLDQAAYSLKNQVRDEEKLGGKLDDDDKSAILEAAQTALDWLDGNQNAEKEEYEEQLQRMQQVSNPIVERVYQQGGADAGPDLGADDEL